MAVITLPINITFKEWAQQLQIDLPNQNILNPPDISKWHEWAEQLLINNSFYAAPLPNRQIYPKDEDWKKWAIYFVSNVQNTQ